MPDAPESRRADAQRNRERILDAAAGVLSRSTDGTLQDIAAEAGLSRATVYRHFSDIDAVRAALLEEVGDLGRQLVEQHLLVGGDDAPFATRLLAMLRTALPIRTRYAEIMAKDPVPDAGLLTAFKPMVEALIRHAQGRSEVRADLDPEVMADALITIGFYTARRVYRDGLAIEDALQVFETLLRGMAANPRAV